MKSEKTISVLLYQGDSMKYVFMITYLFSSFASANVVPHLEGFEDSQILHVAEVKKGMGCTQATASTPYPLSVAQCKILLEKHGMNPRIDARNPMMQIEQEAVIPIGKRLYYIKGPQFTGWTMSGKKD